MTMAPFEFRAGDSPLLVSMPHAGTHVPPAILERLTSEARALPDTDWHLDRLYDFLPALGASRLAATHSRYVVDLNRPADDENLYPGQDTTGVVPIDTFAKQPLYREGCEPGPHEVARRIETYWKPYHARLAQELERLRRAHGYALLWEAHSIFSEVPRFFAGRLPELNLGTAGGASCGPGLGEALLARAAQAQGYSAALNGRFKGGYITRAYGRPGAGVHAVQLELSEATYMEERPPFAFREELAARIRPHLRALLETMLEWGARA
jgi:N-formylglutamate deformylase